jgi:hypothetical protein
MGTGAEAAEASCTTERTDQRHYYFFFIYRKQSPSLLHSIQVTYRMVRRPSPFCWFLFLLLASAKWDQRVVSIYYGPDGEAG